jgi:hypothetical protein
MRRIAAVVFALFALSVSALAQTSTLPITSLPAAAKPLTGLEYFPLVQSGATRKAKVADITDLIEKLSGVYSVVDYLTAEQKADIATGSPTLDLKTTIQSIENNLMPAGGGTLYFVPGTYRWDSTILLSSNRNIRCEKGAVFKPKYLFALFANDSFATIDLRTDTVQPAPENQLDRNYEIDGCKFDFTGLVNSPSPSPIWPYNGQKPAFFVHAQNVNFHDNEIVGADPPLFDGTNYYGWAGGVACISSSNCRYEKNLGIGVHNVFDCFGGGTGCAYNDNRIELVDNETIHRNDNYCLGYNGVGGIPNFHATLENLEARGNYCYTKGWSSCFQFDPLSAGSKVKRVKIVNNFCIAKAGTTENKGIYGRGQLEDVLIDGNTVENVDDLPINVTDIYSSGGPWTCTNCISTTSGDDIVTVAIATLTNVKVVVGNYLQFVSADPVGGITFASKHFEVTEVTSGVQVKVKADVAASSTAGPLGGSVSVQVWQGAPKNVRIVNNHLINSSYVANALIRADGAGIQIGNNSASGGSYGSITYAGSFLRGTTFAPAPVVWGTTGAAGAGMAGAGGDAIDSYSANRNPQTSFPSIVLPHGAAPSATLKRDGQIWSETTGFKARVNGADKSFADLESAQTVSGVKTFSAAPVLSVGAQFAAVAVGSLPACNAGALGVKRYVNDATQALTAGIGAVVAGGGANTVPVGCDGANWRIGG